MLSITDIFRKVPFPVFVSGYSGIGKTTVIDTLIDRYPSFRRPLSFTTRQRRDAETNSEYRFVSHEALVELQSRGEVPFLDTVYGNYYALALESVHCLLSAGCSPIKEVHPSNIPRLRTAFPALVSVLLMPLDREEFANSGRAPVDRSTEDFAFFGSLDMSTFDVIQYVALGDSPASIADLLAKKLTLYMDGLSFFPRSQDIYRTNHNGYTALSEAFTEEKRVTTQNFHTLSLPFFTRVARDLIQPGSSVLEIGPGQGWLRSAVPFPHLSYTVADLCISMLSHNPYSKSIRCDASAIPVASSSFDFVIGSLADPYLYPLALTEIWRVLKPGGCFIFSTPSHDWASSLRDPSQRISTTFVLDDGTPVKVFSFTYPPAILISIAEQCGFLCSAHQAITGSVLLNESVVSGAIVTAAKNAGTDLQHLQIVDTYILKRTS